MKNNNGKKATTKNNEDNEKRTSPFYPYAHWMLAEIKEVYAVENERENRIATKASAFITVIVAIISLYIPMIPLDKVKCFLSNANIYYIEKCLAICLLTVLAIGFLCLVFALLMFVKAYGVKGYNRVNVDDLLLLASKIEKYSETTESQIAQSIAAHYYSILRGTLDRDGNMKINTNSANYVKRGIVWLMIGFVILSIVTVMLRIVVVV